MTDPFARFGSFIVRFRWFVVGIWVVLIALSGAIGSHAPTIVKTGGFLSPNSESDRATQILQTDFHASSSSNLTVAFHSAALTVASPTYKQQVTNAAKRLSRLHTVQSVDTFYSTGNASLVSSDKHTTIVSVASSADQNQGDTLVTDARDALRGVTINHYVTGPSAIGTDTGTASEEDLKRAEFITIPVVLILLLLVFRTVIAAAIPLLLGAAAILMGQALLVPIGSETDVSVFALNVSSMIGLGLGIDFSLIVVSRFRQEMALGLTPADAVATTMATAGRSITYSGITVFLAMAVFTLLMLPMMVVRSISLGVMLVAFTALLAGMTFLPALLALLGHRVDWLPVLPRRKSKGDQGFWYRLSHIIMRYPWPWLAGALLILFVLAFPARELSTVGATAAGLPQSKESVKGAVLLERAFGAGSDAPIQVVIRTHHSGVWNHTFLKGLQILAQQAANDPRNKSVQSLLDVAQAAHVPSSKFSSLRKSQLTSSPALRGAAASFVNINGNNDTALITIVSKTGDTTKQHEGYVDDLRHTIVPAIPQLQSDRVLVGGEAASFIDLRDLIYGRFPFVILAVMAVIFLILMMFFQSLFLPVKAMLMNLASILATYGVLVLVFQHGWGHQLLGFTPIGMVNVITPPILFVILFALSTDYEVFMLSRVKEFYHAGHNNEEAVALGLQNTAGLITAAGLILIGTFGSFGAASVINLKEIGVGLAVAVALDTTIVRVVLVPSTMRLMGDRNWWLPGWLKKIVPEISEGPSGVVVPGLQPAFAIAAASEPGLAPGSPAVASPSPAAWIRPTGGSIGMEMVALPANRIFRIGRDERNELQLFDSLVSRFHAQIEPGPDGYAVRDLGSTNGVYVNYERIPDRQLRVLKPGDTIQVAGKWELSFAFDTAPAPKPAAMS